jgi:hypothetical protein
VGVWTGALRGPPTHTGDAPLDVAVERPRSTEMEARNEVFGADEAASLFYRHYTTGDIPARYTLRPVEDFTQYGRNIALRGDGSAGPL